MSASLPEEAAELTARMAALSPNSPRHRALAEARGFKAAWVGLGRALTEVLEAQAYAGWGYDSFEAYCRQELRLRPDTAAKLTRSYAFVRERRPNALADDSAPPLDVVDLLSQARRRTRLDEAALGQVEEQVLAGETPLSRGQVLRRLRQQDPDAFRVERSPAANDPAAGPGEADEATPPPDAAVLRKLLALAQRLAALLGEHGVRGEARAHAAAVVADLEGRVKPASARLSA